MTLYIPMLHSLEPIILLKGAYINDLPLYGSSVCFLLAGEIEYSSSTNAVFTNYRAPHCFTLILPTSEEGSAFLPKIKAVSPVATLLFLPLDQLMPLLEEDPILTRNLIGLQSSSLYQMTLIASRFSAESPSMRLAMLLLQESVSGKFDISFGVANLARILDISRATLYRSLSELEQLHLIERGMKSIYIINRGDLLDFVVSHAGDT